MPQYFIRTRNLNFSISIGATLVNDDDTIECIVKRVDTSLYKGKTAERNRLTIEEGILL